MGLLSCFGRLLAGVFFFIASPLRWIGLMKKGKVESEQQTTRQSQFDGGTTNKVGDDSGWQEWGPGDSFSVDVDPASKPRLPSNMHQQETESIGHGQGKMVDGNNEDELEDINLFEDMQPAFRRAKKITVRTCTSDMSDDDSSKLSTRLAMESVPLSPSSELGTWNENVSTWEDETKIDDSELTQTAKNTMREKREAERVRRQAEVEKKRQERESQRQHRMLGTKLDS